MLNLKQAFELAQTIIAELRQIRQLLEQLNDKAGN